MFRSGMPPTGAPKTVGQPIIIDFLLTMSIIIDFLLTMSISIQNILSDNKGIVSSMQLAFCPPMID